MAHSTSFLSMDLCTLGTGYHWKHTSFCLPVIWYLLGRYPMSLSFYRTNIHIFSTRQEVPVVVFPLGVDNVVVVVSFVSAVVDQTPVRAVWPNYKVMEFQPWPGTTPDLGSVAIVPSQSSPRPTIINRFLDHPPPPPCPASFRPPIRHHSIDLHQSFAPYSAHIFYSWVDCTPTLLSLPPPPAPTSCPCASLPCPSWPATQYPSRPLKSHVAGPCVDIVCAWLCLNRFFWYLK